MDRSLILLTVFCSFVSTTGYSATIIHAGRLIDGAATSREPKCRS